MTSPSEPTEWEPCGRGICAANEGHEGTCDQASGWDAKDAPYEIQRLINDLDDARADGTTYTYGMVQARLVEILKAGA